MKRADVLASHILSPAVSTHQMTNQSPQAIAQPAPQCRCTALRRMSVQLGMQSKEAEVAHTPVANHSNRSSSTTNPWRPPPPQMVAAIPVDVAGLVQSLVVGSRWLLSVLLELGSGRRAIVTGWDVGRLLSSCSLVEQGLGALGYLGAGWGLVVGACGGMGPAAEVATARKQGACQGLGRLEASVGTRSPHLHLDAALVDVHVPMVNDALPVPQSSAPIPPATYREEWCNRIEHRCVPHMTDG
jgi:hypothetical protein